MNNARIFCVLTPQTYFCPPLYSAVKEKSHKPQMASFVLESLISCLGLIADLIVSSSPGDRILLRLEFSAQHQ